MIEWKSLTKEDRAAVIGNTLHESNENHRKADECVLKVKEAIAAMGLCSEFVGKMTYGNFLINSAEDIISAILSGEAIKETTD